MSIQLQLRRSTASEINNFVGAEGELTVVTDDWSLRLHDGVTAGGHQIGKKRASSYVITSSNVSSTTITEGNTYVIAEGVDLSSVEIPYFNSVDETRIYFSGLPSDLSISSEYMWIKNGDATGKEAGAYVLCIVDGIGIFGTLTGLPKTS